MRLALLFGFWIAIAPAVFFLLLDLLVLPAKWVVDSLWAAHPPTPVWVATQVYALIGIFAAGWAVWFLWKRFRATFSADPDLRGGTWIEKLAPSLRLPVALSLILAGAALVFIGARDHAALGNLRSDLLLLGGLIQALGVVGVALVLRGRRPTRPCS